MQYAFDFCGGETANRHSTKRNDALFFAILPSDEMRARTVQLRKRLVAENSLQGALLKPERFHISVLAVGEFANLRHEHIEMAKQAANIVSLPSFEMTFDAVASFGRARRDGRQHKRPLVLFGPADGLSELHGSLAGRFRRTGSRAAGKFAPHMTLLYSPMVVATTPIEPIHFAVSEFVLIHSEVGLTRHHVLGRWPLHGPSAPVRCQSVPRICIVNTLL